MRNVTIFYSKKNEMDFPIFFKTSLSASVSSLFFSIFFFPWDSLSQILCPKHKKSHQFSLVLLKSRLTCKKKREDKEEEDKEDKEEEEEERFFFPLNNAKKRLYFKTTLLTALR